MYLLFNVILVDYIIVKLGFDSNYKLYGPTILDKLFHHYHQAPLQTQRPRCQFLLRQLVHHQYPSRDLGS